MLNLATWPRPVSGCIANLLKPRFYVFVLQVGSPFTLEIPLGAISSIEKVGKSKKKERKDALYGLELVCKVCCDKHRAYNLVNCIVCYSVLLPVCVISVLIAMWCCWTMMDYE